ncbi:MAG: hypothetical protein HY453_01295 [Parcubacteria group bacterium]|nr:hypothetical protein [Parcubacteria group bacterium]
MWSDLKKKLIKEGYSEVSGNIGQLKMISPGGNIAGEARKKLELKSGKKVSDGENYLSAPKKKRKPIGVGKKKNFL